MCVAMIEWGHGPREQIDVGLLPYTELTKDHVQDIFSVHQARDLAYGLGSIAQFLCP